MEKACLGAKSIAQVCRNLGLKPAGGYLWRYKEL